MSTIVYNINNIPPETTTSTSCDSASQSMCKHVFAAIECLKNVFQGENITLEILLAGADRVLLDLDEYTSYYILLYDDANNMVCDFSYPSVTGDYQLEILQETIDDIIVNRGKIAIELTSEMTSNMLTGNLYAEIKIQSATDTHIITCLLLAKIKASRINQFQVEI